MSKLRTLIGLNLNIGTLTGSSLEPGAVAILSLKVVALIGLSLELQQFQAVTSDRLEP